MADRVENFLLELLTLLQQAERHLHNDNLNMVEYIRRRLDDYYIAVQTILMYCMEQMVCNEVMEMLREIYERVSAILEQYNEICNHHPERNGQIESLPPFSFDTEQTHEPGRPRLNISAEVVTELHKIQNSWSAVARQTGVSYRTLLRRRREYGFQIANTVGPRSTYTDIDEEQLCRIVRDCA